MSRRGRGQAGALRATRHFPRPGPGSPKPSEEGAWIFTFYGKGATPDFISGHQIGSSRP